MKYIVVIVDGAAGWKNDELHGQTSLEAASIPLLDTLARHGRCGMAKTVPDGIEPSSSAACTSIVGYHPGENFVGRGAIEAAALGIELADNEVALRVNTLTTQDGIMKSYACGHISSEESRAIVERLAEQLNDETFTLYPGVAYRHILVVKDHPELLDLTYTSPHDITDQPTDGQLPRGGEGAQLLLDFMDRARELLKDDPTNAARRAAGAMECTDLWPFWPGTAPASMVPFAEKYHKTAALSSGVDLLFGIAKIFSIDPLRIEGVTDGMDNDFEGQTLGSLEALADHDLVVIHIEAPDEMGHAGDAHGKVEALETIDRKVIARVMAYAKSAGDTRVLVMPDHPTPLERKTHSNEPVPFVLWGKGIEPNGAFGFTEAAAASTGLLLDPGYQVMEQLLAE